MIKAAIVCQLEMYSARASGVDAADDVDADDVDADDVDADDVDARRVCGLLLCLGPIIQV